MTIARKKAVVAVKEKAIKEIIVVEGKDDTSAIKRACVCTTLETHGFGVTSATFSLLDKAYRETGLVIFTDPDHAGEFLRRRLASRYPKAKHAFLTREEATASADGDIGIENAQPEAIMRALENARCLMEEIPEKPEFTRQDLFDAGLDGARESGLKRQALGKILGIGYGNSRAFLDKLNKFKITREEFNEALCTLNDQRYQR